MKILLTGATGFIGKHLCKRLLENKIEVELLVRKAIQSEDLIGQKVPVVVDPGADGLVKLFKEKQYTGIIHLASLFIKEHSSEQISPLVESNIEFPARLLEAASKADVAWFLNTGTFWQHYQSQDYSPVNLYAATKQAFEDLAKYYVETSEISFLTVKINDTYGPGDTRPKVMNLFQKIAKSGETLRMSGGEQEMDILHINDIISGFAQAVVNLNAKIYPPHFVHSRKLAAAQRVNLQDLAKMFEGISGKTLHIEWGAMPYREREVMEPWVTGEVLENWQPQLSLEEGVQEFIAAQ